MRELTAAAEGRRLRTAEKRCNCKKQSASHRQAPVLWSLRLLRVAASRSLRVSAAAVSADDHIINVGTPDQDSPCHSKRRVESFERERDLLVAMCGGDEPGLER